MPHNFKLRAAALGVCLYGILCGVANQAAADCRLTRVLSADFRTLADGRITVPVKFLDRELYFLVDTGGFISTVNPEVTSALNLHLNMALVPARGLNMMMTQTVRPDSFSFGPLHGKGLMFYVQPTAMRDMSG